MRQEVKVRLEDWVQHEFAGEDRVDREMLLQHARGSDLPKEACDLLGRLPEVHQRPQDIVAEIERMTEGVPRREGNAGGMNAGSSGEMRPGAFGGTADDERGGSGSGIHG